jgi:REP element-mobilizing transposase RayT
MNPKGWHSRGYLPHFDSPEVVQHVVFRTAESLPKHLLASAPQDPIARGRSFNDWLDAGVGGSTLADAAAAGIVQSALLHFDQKRYRLVAWCIMPNHVHAVLETKIGESLGPVVKSWKAWTARAINAEARRSGPFWAPDYFDRYVRNERELEAVVAYVEHNPCRAGLCVTPADWPWSSARSRTR